MNLRYGEVVVDVVAVVEEERLSLLLLLLLMLLMVGRKARRARVNAKRSGLPVAVAVG